MKKLDNGQCVLRVVDRLDDASSAKSEVYVNGVKAEGFVSGAILEMCVEIRGCYVVFSVDDNCFEGTLWIDLFDAQLKLKDSVNLTWIDAGSDFEFAGFGSQESILFKYFGRTYALKVWGEKKFRLPLVSDLAEIWKGFRFSSYLEVRLVKKP